MSSEQAIREVSVVVPVYKSSAVLPLLAEELQRVLNGCASRYELILVNDASPDQSWQVITELARQYQWVEGINLMRNVGQHNALLCGIRAAKYEIIVTIDDDLQNPPAEIPRLLAKLEEGFDVVYGTPEQERHGLLRDLASKITKLVLQNAMGAEIARNISAFRVFRTKVREAFQNDTLWSFAGPARAASGRGIRLHGAQAGGARIKHDDGIQCVATSACKFHRFCIYRVWAVGACVCNWEVLSTGKCCAGFPISCFAYHRIFRGAAVCAGDHRRIPVTYAFSHDGPASLHCALDCAWRLR